MSAPVQSPSVVPFGNYLLDELIAVGGMARVYRARLRGLGGFEKPLVVKQVRPELARDPAFVRMFVDEAKTLVRMSHPHIVPVYELGVVDGTYFLAMEHVDGATLAAVLAEGPLDPSLVAHLGAQVCDALAYAHERHDLVHRDVTPRNILLDAAGHARLVDFGIATPADGTASAFGTPGFMAPEQLRGESVGPAADLFALGAVLFEAVTGRPALEGASPAAVRAATLERALPRLAADAAVPAGLARAIDGCLVRDPAARVGSATELGRQLRGYLASTRPEGVAPELGVRAIRARTHAAPPSASGGTPATGRAQRVVKTLATSAALDRLWQQADESTSRLDAAPDAHGVTSGPGADASGSRPAEVDAASGSRVDEVGTAPIAGRRGRGSTDASEATSSSSESDAASSGVGDPSAVASLPVASRTGLRRALAPLMVLGVLGMGALAYVLWTPSGDATGEPADDPGSSGSEGPVAHGAAERAAEGAAGAPGDRPAHVAEAADVGGRGDDVAPRHDAERTAPRGAGTEGVGAGRTGDDETAAAVPPGPEGAAGRGSEGPEPASTRGTARPVTLFVNSTPWTQVTLDGRAIGATPVRRARIQAGERVLSLDCPPLGRRAEVRFTANEGASVRVTVDMFADPPAITVGGAVLR